MELQSSRILQLKVVAMDQILRCRAAGRVPSLTMRRSYFFARDYVFSSLMFSPQGWWLRGSTCNMWMFPRAKGGPEAKLSGLARKDCVEARNRNVHPSFTFDLETFFACFAFCLCKINSNSKHAWLSRILSLGDQSHQIHSGEKSYSPTIGLWEHLQETMVFTIKNWPFR